jgi:N-acetylneuraminic acid mutarotase
MEKAGKIKMILTPLLSAIMIFAFVSISHSNDTTTPITTLATTPSSPDGTNSWFKTTPTINLTSDEPGTTYYQWNVQESGWETMAPLPTPRWAVGADVVNGKIYCIGGWIGSGASEDATNVVEEYNPATNAWTTKTPMPTPRRYRYFAVYDNKIYVIGGYNKTEGFINKVEVYDPATDTWDTSKTPMPTHRRAVFAATVNGKIYVIGGAGQGATPGQVVPLDIVEIYDPLTDTWTNGTPMPQKNSHFGGAVVDGKIYIIGGWDHQSPPTYYNNVYVYDPVTDTWQEKTAMPTSRARMGMVAVGGEIYSIGGNNSSVPLTNPLDIAEVYDVATDSWSVIPSLSLSPARTGIPLVAYGGRLYVIGGWGVSDLDLNEATYISWTNYSAQFNAQDGENLLYYYSVDTAGNAEIVNSRIFKVDTITPTTTASPDGGVYNTSQSVILACNDGAGSGCDEIYYNTDGSTPTTSSLIYSSPINISKKTTLKFFAVDMAGNQEGVKTEVYNIVVKLLAPNGGEVIPSGSTYNIHWEALPKAVKFNLLYSLNNGATWKTIANNGGGGCTDCHGIHSIHTIGCTDCHSIYSIHEIHINTNAESNNWKVPCPKNNMKKCLVKVRGYNSSNVKIGEDTSDSTFTIEVVKVVSPNGGQALQSGNAWRITWQTNCTIRPVIRVKLFYTINDGSTWTLIRALTGNPGGYNWTVPNVSSSSSKVKVVLKDANGNTVGSDVSDAYFAIQP